jgi:hypothetical protein
LTDGRAGTPSPLRIEHDLSTRTARAEIEMVCHDALRTSIMESAVEVTPESFGAAIARMEIRRATSGARSG